MRILLIYTQYHPAINPNVFRWSAIAEYWTQQGQEVHVLCTQRSGTPKEALVKGVWVHRIGHASLLDMLYNVLGMTKRRGELGGERPVNKGRWRSIVERMMDITWRNIYWPDGSCVWYFSGRKRALMLQKQYHYDAIISISQPFTAHLIAAAIKKQFPLIRWVMDIEDPFSFVKEIFVNNHYVYQRFNYKKEEQLFSLSDAISVTVERTRQRYLQHFPQFINKIKVTPPLYVIPGVGSAFKKELNAIHLAYFGAFYNPIRTPHALLALFYRIQNKITNTNLILHFFGEIPPVFHNLFEYYQRLVPNLRLHGLVSRAQAAAAMSRMDFLINVGNKTDYHLPSKCVDYLMSGKPIINLSFCRDDPFTDFMREYPFLLTLDIIKSVDDTMIDDVLNFITSYNGRQVTQAYLDDLIQPYTIDKIAARYFMLLQNTAG